jgi:hypothetical protein
MPYPQKFLQYSAGLFLLVLTVIISASGGVFTVNVNLNIVLPPSLEGDIMSEKPSYYSLPLPPVEDYPRQLPNPPDDEFLYPPDSERYNEFNLSPMVPGGNPAPNGDGKGFFKQKPQGSGGAVNPPLDVETAHTGSGRIGFF